MCRVPCEHEGKNLAVRVEDTSRAPSHLAVRFLYQGGQTDIVAVDVAQVNTNTNLAPRGRSIVESRSDRRVSTCV
jgi:hypothetical protein